MRRRLAAFVIGVFAGVATHAAASPHGLAQNRCLVLGFKDPTNLALCTEYELGFAEPERIGLGALNGPQNKCMVLGFTGEGLAACTQRKLRDVPAASQPPYDIHGKP